MKKVFKHYILSEKEMDKINYLLDFIGLIQEI